MRGAQISFDDFERPNVDHDFEFGIHCVKVRRRMFSPEHLDDDSEKAANRWHGEIIGHVFAKNKRCRLADSPSALVRRWHATVFKTA